MHHWERISDQPVDVTKWIPLFALDVLGVTVFSRNFNAMKGEEDKDLAYLNVVLREMNLPKNLLLGKVGPIHVEIKL